MKSDSQETSNPTKDEEENKYILGNDVENFFDSLFNRGGHPNVDRRYLKTTVPDDNESVTLKLINSKLVCYPKKEYKIPPPNDNESYEYYIPGVKGSTSILFPAFSSLNVKEQNILYRYHSLMFYNVRVLTEQETAEFKELMNKANIDYPAYQSFVYNQWIHLHAPRVRQIPPGVKLYTEYLWHTKAEQCLQLFPNYYKTLNSTIPLTLNDPHKAYAVMDFVRHVFVRGTPARMSLPSVKSPCELLTDFRDLCKIKPVAVEDKDLRVNPVIRQRVPISMDSFVEYCMNREPNIDVVITNSGIKTIVDIDRFKKDWILPVTIKNVPLENGEIKKIVIIDKKLPTNVMSVHDLNVWHGKIAAKWALILAFSPHLLQNDGVAAAAEKTATDTSDTEERPLTQYDDIDIEDHDVFGIDQSPGNEKKLIKCKSKNPEQLNPLDSIPGREIEEGEIFDIREFLKSTNKCHSSPSISTQGAKEVESEQKKLFPKTIPPRRSTPKIMNHCNQYSLWKLHKNVHFQMLKQEQRTLNVLVRSRIDGKLNYKRCNNWINDIVHISSKLEFQPEYGACKIDASQLSREYVDLHLRPSCKLARVRTVGHTKEVMLNEIKPIHEIRENLQMRRVFTNKIFDPLYAVLTSLVDLPVGKYLLQHTPKLEAFAQLLIEDPNGQNFKLPSYFSELKETDAAVPVGQVDQFVLTRIHTRDRMPPALFKPCPIHKGNFFTKPNRPLKRKKRKSANKNVKPQHPV